MAKQESWSAEDYARHGRFVADLASAVIALLAPVPGERLLDLGCGDGVLTAEFAAGGMNVVGVDSSPDLVEAARARGVEARLMDAQALTFAAEFDAVFSNAALHWMRNPDGVIAGVRRALRPGGRFVGEFGGHGNVAAISVACRAALAKQGVAMQSPWYFPTPAEYRVKLEAHRFRVEEISLIPRPTALPTDMEGWLRTFAHPMLNPLEAKVRAAVEKDAVELLRPELCDTTGRWTADYVRLRFRAIAE